MKKAKFNAVDAIIIVVLVAGIVFGILFLNGMFGGGTQSAEAQNVTVEYQVEFTGKDKELVEIPKVGDKVNVGVKEKVEAEVINVDIQPARRLTTTTVGTPSIQWQEIPDEYDMTLTLRSDGTESESAVTAGALELRVGSEAVVRGKGYSIEGYILDLDTAAKEAANND